MLLSIVRSFFIQALLLPISSVLQISVQVGEEILLVFPPKGRYG